MHLSLQALGAKESMIRQMSVIAEKVDKPYRLYFGESDLPTPEFICRAAADALREGHTFYTPTAGYLELREAVAAKVREIHGAEYRPSEVVCTAGGVMAIFLALRALLDPGDNVLVLEPSWPLFNNIIGLLGAEARPVPLALEGQEFVLDLDRVRALADARTRLLIVNSPGNPTGWVIGREEQEALWQLALERDFVILSDEVYDRIVFDRPVAPSFTAVATDKDHLVVVNSFSKTYNMTGWRLGYALVAEELARVMTKLEEYVVSNPPAMAQRAGIVALREGEDYVKDLLGKYARRRQVVVDRLRTIPRVALPNPVGGFYAFPRLEGLRDSLSFAKDLLLEARVGMVPGVAFGQSGEGHLRMCFAQSEEVLVPALDAFSEFVERSLGD